MSAVATLRRDPALWGLGLGFVLLYGPLFPELVRDWSSNGDFSHGFLVPVIAGWLLWLKRDELASTPASAWLPGAMLLALGVGQYLIGVAASEFYLQRTSMVPFLGGWILLVWGRGWARHWIFPVTFLLFMIPPPSLLWTQVSFPLQLLASQITEGTLAVLGVGMERAGNVIHLENCSLEVAHACSGLRSLVTLLAMGAVLAEGSLVGSGGPRTAWGRWALFLAAIPVAVAVNVVRVSGTAVAAVRLGPEVATGWLHDVTGLVTFGLSLLLLWWIRRGLAWIESLAPSRSA